MIIILISLYKGNLMNRYMSNLSETFGNNVDTADAGSFIDDLVLMAGLALTALVVGNWVSTAATNFGADVASCIEGANTFTDPNATSTNCSSQNHAENNSFKDQETYTSRY